MIKNINDILIFILIPLSLLFLIFIIIAIIRKKD